MIDEIWDCPFKIRNLLYISNRTREEIGETKINDLITFSASKYERGDLLKGKIKIVSKSGYSPIEIRRRAREILYFLIELTREQIGGGFGTFDVKPFVEIEEPELINVERGHRCHPGIKAALSFIRANAETLTKMTNIFNKYNKLQSEDSAAKLAIRWFVKSISSPNPIDNFISSWITFNMLYGWLTGAINHVKGI